MTSTLLDTSIDMLSVRSIVGNVVLVLTLGRFQNQLQDLCGEFSPIVNFVLRYQCLLSGEFDADVGCKQC